MHSLFDACIEGQAVVAGNDPYFSSVVALLHFDGTNGSTTFTDQKGHTFNANGNAQINTSTVKYGTGAGLFDGTGDYLDSATSADWNFGSGDFTIEGWVNPAGASTYALLDINRASGFDHAYLRVSANKLLMSFANSTGSGYAFTAVATTTSLPASTWTHFAVVRNGTSFKVYINGVHDAAPDATYAGAIYFSGDTLHIGHLISSSTYWNGSIDDLRITKGVARYTANFTPPAAAYPDS